MAGVRGGASGDGAQAKELSELAAQVSYLEQEVSVLRRKLADSPRQVRSLEEGLARDVRAESVKRYLVEHGIDTARIQTRTGLVDDGGLRRSLDELRQRVQREEARTPASVQREAAILAAAGL